MQNGVTIIVKEGGGAGAHNSVIGAIVTVFESVVTGPPSLARIT
jgi:hypothetical protein